MIQERHISDAALQSIVQAGHIENLSVEDIFTLFRREKGLEDFLPDAAFETDPRDGSLIVYNTARSRRPHDHVLTEPPVDDGKPCPICQGKTTGVIDVAPLSQGRTFINKNLFPILRAIEQVDPEYLEQSNGGRPSYLRGVSYGLHFLQWTSSFHDRDWHNMPLADRIVVMERLAALEGKLLLESAGLMPRSDPGSLTTPTYGYVSIIKNYGSLVGGSLQHGHQQIAFSNVMPRRLHNNWLFLEHEKEAFTAHLLRETPDELVVRDYETAVLLVPYFMRRPYDMMLVLKDYRRQHLFELSAEELSDTAEGWHDAIGLIRAIMPRIGKQLAYNVTTHNGPGAGLYFEFLPYTQETGGFEHLGLWVCQGNPTDAAERLRSLL